jgi:hypothetical protein
VNKQNFRYWAAENPRELHARPLQSPKVTVWCTLSSIGVIGPYFFEEGGVTVTVNANRYCDMLEKCLRPKNDEDGEEHLGSTSVQSKSEGPYQTNNPRF